MQNSNNSERACQAAIMFKFYLQPNEKLLAIHRQAEIVLIKLVLTVFALIYIPWSFLIKYELHIRFRRLLLVWTAGIVLYALYKYLLWLINVYVITNKRLIAINYKSLIHKIVQETPIDRIHNISSETQGFFKSLLKIGDVIVQVTSLTQPMVLRNLKKPEAVKDFLWNVHKPPEQVVRTENSLSHNSKSNFKN